MSKWREWTDEHGERFRVRQHAMGHTQVQKAGVFEGSRAVGWEPLGGKDDIAGYLREEVERLDAKLAERDGREQATANDRNVMAQQINELYAKADAAKTDRRLMADRIDGAEDRLEAAVTARAKLAARATSVESAFDRLDNVVATVCTTQDRLEEQMRLVVEAAEILIRPV